MEGLFDIGKAAADDLSTPAVLARKLANTLHSKGHKVKANISNWINEIKRLAETYDINTIQWLIEAHCCAIANSKKHLKVYSAKSLVRRFQELRKFYNGNSNDIKLSKEQKLVLSHVSKDLQNWSPEHSAKLPAVIKLSHENYSKLWLKLKELDNHVQKMLRSIEAKKYEGKLPPGQARLLLHWYIYSRGAFEISIPDNFTINWIKRIKNYLNGFPDWEGDFLRFVWEIDNEHFIKAVNVSIRRFTQSSKLHWNLFVAEFLN